MYLNNFLLLVFGLKLVIITGFAFLWWWIYEYSCDTHVYLTECSYRLHTECQMLTWTTRKVTVVDKYIYITAKQKPFCLPPYALSNIVDLANMNLVETAYSSMLFINSLSNITTTDARNCIISRMFEMLWRELLHFFVQCNKCHQKCPLSACWRQRH